MSEFDAVLIYDGDCPFCSAASSALRRVDDAGAVAWDHESAQRFLEAQFDDTPFALVLVDGERVYVGRDAAEDLCDRAGLPVLVGDIVDDNYEGLADAIRTVTGVERDPNPFHGTYPIAPAAREAHDDLQGAATGAPLRMRSRER